MERFVLEKPSDTRPCTNSKGIDLTLRLSLNGPCVQNAKFLTRSSAMAGGITHTTLVNGVQGSSSVSLVNRSSSLPSEAEQGLIRFGDLQTMRRVETGKRLLLEKQKRTAAAAAAAAAVAENSLLVSPPPLAAGERPVLPQVVPWAAASTSKSPALVRAFDSLKMVANPHGDSIHMGPRGLTDVGIELENPPKKLKPENPCTLKGDPMDILRQMPSVTTTGDGPNGQKIEGFLYRYRRGQVCIVCVCHGSFLSPAEFVVHAGGKEVANPMRHITVCSSSF